MYGFHFKKKRMGMMLVLPVLFLITSSACVSADDSTFSPVTVTTEKLAVTGGAPVAPSASTGPVTITTEKLTATGGALRQPPQAPFNPVNVTTEKLTVTGR